MGETVKIHEVEQQTGLTRKAVRYYEQSGLFKTNREENNYKVYTPENVKTLQKIKQYRLLGFSVNEIKSLLEENEVSERILKDYLQNISLEMGQLKEKQGCIEKLLAGQNILELPIEKSLVESRKKEYIAIQKDNVIFGAMNTVSCIITVLIMLWMPVFWAEKTAFYIYALCFTLHIALYQYINNRANETNGEKLAPRNELTIKTLQFLRNQSLYIYCGASINVSIEKIKLIFQGQLEWQTIVWTLISFFILGSWMIYMVSYSFKGTKFSIEQYEDMWQKHKEYTK